MANSFHQLPTPVGNGVGPTVDVSDLGPIKTLLVGGDFDAVVAFETSSDGGATFGPFTTAQGPFFETFQFSATHMRVRISGLLSGTPVCYAGSEVTGSKKAILAVPAGNGSGAPADISAFGDLLTLVVNGSFGGSISIEVSDNGTEWSPLAFFNNPGISTKSCFAKFVRVFRAGVGFDPGLPVIAVAASDTVGSAGITALSQPIPSFLFRPFDPDGPHDNVYGDTSPDGGWSVCYAALREAAPRGPCQVEFDFQFCPGVLYPSGATFKTYTFPARGNNLGWDMRNIEWFAHQAQGISFAEGCFLYHLHDIQFLSLCSIFHNNLYTTPIVIGGPSPYGGNQPGQGWGGARIDWMNFTPGVKPMWKQGGASVFSPVGNPVYGDVGGIQLGLGGTGNPPLSVPSPLIDMGGQSLTIANLIFENNTFTSLAGAVLTGPATNLTAALPEGSTVIPVISTAGFPASGTVELNTFGYGEPFVYTSITPTSFIGSVGTKNPYFGPGGAALGSAVVKPIALEPGSTTIPVVSTAGFAASGSLRFNGNSEVVTYTGITATSFTGVSPTVGAYTRGFLVEPIRAVASAALPAGSTAIPVDSTTGFPATGSLFLYQNGVSETVLYTGITATSFTGVGPTVNTYGVGAIMERVSSFRGGALSNHMLMSIDACGRAGSMIWQMPNLDLTAVTVGRTGFGFSNGTSIRTRKIIRALAPKTPPVATTTTAALAVGATTIPVVSTAGYPTANDVLVLNNGAETVRYTAVTATSFTGCTPTLKAHALGIPARLAASFGELVLLNATAAVEIQLPTASRSFGDECTIKEASGGAAGVTIVPFTGQTIDTVAGPHAMAGAFAVRRFVSNGVGGWLSV